MAQLSGYGGGGSSSLTAEIRSRERERQRRYGTEKTEDIPSFSEPRKITERQDSLSNRIQNVLGDIRTVQKVIERSPNVWLGTSRTAPAPKNNSAPERTRTPREGSMNNKSIVSSSSYDVPSQQGIASRSVSSSSTSNSVLSDESRSNKSHSTYPGMTGRLQESSRDVQRKSMMNRSRLQSMDMPAAMENIFREMRMNEEEPISAIQTPLIAQDSAKNELKSKFSIDSVQHADEGNSHKNSESESSDDDDDTDSDDSDRGEKTKEWNLFGLMSDFDPHSSAESIRKAEDGSTSRNNHTRVQLVERIPYNVLTSHDAPRSPKDEKNSEKRTRGRPLGSGRSSASRVSSSQHPSSDQRRNKDWSSTGKSLQSKSAHKQSNPRLPASESAHRVEFPAHSPPPPPDISFRLKNEAAPPLHDSPPPERHRTAKKSPKNSFRSSSSSSSSSEEESLSSDDSSRHRPSFDESQANKQSVPSFTSETVARGERDVERHAHHRTSKQEKVLRLSESNNNNKGSTPRTSSLSQQQTIYRPPVVEKPPDLKRSTSPVSQLEKVKKFPALWVKLPVFSSSSVGARSSLCNSSPDRNRGSWRHADRASWGHTDRQLQNSRCDSTGFVVSSDNFTEHQSQSIEAVQISTDVTSSNMSPHQQRYAHKRPTAKQPAHKKKSKKRKTETPQNVDNDGNQTMRETKQRKKESEEWKESKESPYAVNQWNNPSISNQQVSLANKQAISSANDPTSSAASLQEPDSSWPEQETRFKTSEQFMREGKRLKHEGDSYTDSKTGRTRNGESLSRALLYFEASLCFLMNGYMLEVENSGDRGDGPRASHSPTSMYNQTISLLDYIRKMRPHDGKEETAFKRLNISCLRTQALLFLRIFKLKKEVAGKYHEAMSDHFKSNRLNHVPSPWHSTASQNAVSPVSPAVPSPYGAPLPGPSPLASSNTCEQVSSSTQVSKITSPPSQNGVLLSPKIHEMFKQYHTIMGSLMQAHDKWDQAENLVADHADFFRHVDVLGGHSLNLDNSLKDLETYNKAILRRLRGTYKSPKD